MALFVNKLTSFTMFILNINIGQILETNIKQPPAEACGCLVPFSADDFYS